MGTGSTATPARAPRTGLRAGIWLLRHNGGLRHLAVSRFVSLLGSGMAPVGLAFACLSRDSIGVRGLGYAVAAITSGELIFTGVGGVLADRVGPRRTMMLGQLQAAAAQTVVALLFLSDHVSVAALVPMSFVFGAGDAMAQPAISAMVRRLVGDDDLPPANALVRSAGVAARAVSAPLAGVLVLVVAAPWALVVDAVSYLVSAALLLRSGVTVAMRGGSVLGDLRGGWNAVRARPWIVWLAVSAALVNAARAGGVTVLGPVQVRHNGGAGLWGLILGVQAVASVVTVWTVGQWRARRALTTAGSAVLCVAALLVGLAYPVYPAALLVLAFAAAGSISYFALTFDVVVQTYVPLNLVGRVGAFANVLSMTLTPVGPVMSSELNALLGPSHTLLLWAVVVVVAVAGLVSGPAVRRFEESPTRLRDDPRLARDAKEGTTP